MEKGFDETGLHLEVELKILSITIWSVTTVPGFIIDAFNNFYSHAILGTPGQVFPDLEVSV